MRKALGYLAILFSIASLFLATAGATPAWADPPGNNGTVKIHEGATENEPIRANEPHVCTFHIHGFNFDGTARGTWRIEGWPPTGGGTYNGTWGPADGNGDWRSPETGAMSLPEGHYKLFVWQTMPNDPPGDAKHKVFWVECGSSSSTTTGNSSGDSNGSSNGNSNGSSNGTSNGNSNGNSNGVSTGVNAGASTGTSTGVTSGVSSGVSTGFSTGVTTGVSSGGSAVAGVQTAPNPLAGVQNLPSTSTDPSIPLGGLGLAMIALGVALLSRRPASPS